MLETILQENYVGLVTIIGLWVFVCNNRMFDRKITNIFKIFMVCVFSMMVFECLDYYFESFDHYVFARNITSAAGYTLTPVILMLFSFVIGRKYKYDFLLWLPALFVAVVAFTSPLTKVMFYFTSDNLFVRGPMGYLSHIVSGLYLLHMISISLFNFNVIDKAESFIIYMIALCIAGTTAIESIGNFRFLLTDVIIIAGMFYYMYLYSQIYRRDPLTNTLNRRCFYTDSKKYQNGVMAIVSMDINGLKTINDNYGYAEGDIAIQTFANVAKKVAPKGFVLYRTGGAEFMALGIKKEEAETEKFITDIKLEMAKTKYSVSCGYVIYVPQNNFEECCKASDSKMYMDKRRHKEERAMIK